MSINDLLQKKNLLNKLGLGVPKMSSNIRVSQNTSSQPPKPSQPQTQPKQPAPQPQPQPKPGCGGCRRKK